jgi:spermidine synthase
MSILHLDRRPDGSLSLFIDGDLQFDSRDERVYHECLVLPALAMAGQAGGTGLRALICGGGDGLAAREVLKSPAVAHVDLVDYDSQVVGMARQEWPDLHDRAFDDPRLTVHHADAWAFVANAWAAGQRYDLIVVDLTVPQDVTVAAFHSVEWYERLAALLTPTGALAVNALSPSATPEAYWTPYNALRHVGLYPKPYRIALASFTEQGYGPDWGFLLASPTPITAARVAALDLARPRLALRDTAHVARLFHLPVVVAGLRGGVAPVRQGDDTLLRRLGQRREPLDPEPVWDALAEAVDAAPLPAIHQAGLLPEPVREAIAAGPDTLDGDALLERVLEVMPALQPQHTRTMIETLLHDPARFLAPIDLAGLVDRLLVRAAELPARIVGELRHLQAHLRERLSDTGALLRAGMRVVTVVVVVVIVANLVFPDSAYGKGGGVHVGGSGSLSRSAPIAGSVDEPTVARGTGFRRYAPGRHQAIDEGGLLYPARRFRFGHHYYWVGHHHHSAHATQASPSEATTNAESIYRLSPEADVLDDGRIALTLTERTYLIVANDSVRVMDGTSGDEVMVLERPENLVYRLGQELDRQRRGLAQTIKAKRAWNAWVSWVSFTPWYTGDQAEMRNLQHMQVNLAAAMGHLRFTPGAPPEPLTAPVSGAHELFTSVWLLPDGSGILAKLADGTLAMLDERRWTTLTGASLDTPYPAGFRRAVTDVLATMVKDSDATYKSLTQDLGELQIGMASLERDEREYSAIEASSGAGETVEYGSIEIPVSDALRRTRADILTTRRQLQDLETRMADWPRDVYNARRLLLAFGRDRGPS